MKKLISIVEIPTTVFARAASFYNSILNADIEEMEMGGIKMGLLSNSGEDVYVHLIHGEEYKPSVDGVVVYLNCGNDLQQVAIKVAENGGRIIIPKTEIAPDIGFYAMFTDTEGNRLGLYSTS